MSKSAILTGLDQAAKPTPKKGYDKGPRAFEILEGVDPAQVQAAAPWACRLLKTMDELILGRIQRSC